MIHQPLIIILFGGGGAHLSISWGDESHQGVLIVFIKIYSYRSLLAVAGRGLIRSIPIQSHVVVTGILVS